MAIPFCLKCGKILSVKDGVGKCSCGYSGEIREDFSTKEKTRKIKKGEGIVSSAKSESGFPHKCKKCGHVGAEVMDLGVQVADEANIYLFKCLKCGHAERQADGSCNL